VLLFVGLGGAFSLNWQSGAISVAYFLLTILYTFRVKRLVLYDVFTLAFLYSIRLFAGQAAYGVSLSTWLVSCCFFLFLSLAFCKRTSELVNHRSATPTAGLLDDVQLLRRDYRLSDLPIISCFGVVAGMLAGLITVLYVESENVRKLYHHPQVLWFLCPLLLQWVARNWILASRGQITEDPVLFVLKERATWITTAVGAALMLAASL
jgi:4-hydroxybenzoate polyprenyltransferase